MKQIKAYIRLMREAAGGWGIAWAIWIALALMVQLGLIIYQTNQPGAYDSPEKTELRRNVNMVFSLGVIGLMIPCMQQIRRWQEAQQNRQVTSTTAHNEETADHGAT
jgi:hypothetical protein